MDLKTSLGKLVGKNSFIYPPSGNRYDVSGKDLPNLRKWGEENAGIDFTKLAPK
jgi:alkyldihydroxyacetonephosphate synthase